MHEFNVHWLMITMVHINRELYIYVAAAWIFISDNTGSNTLIFAQVNTLFNKVLENYITLAAVRF